MPRDIVDTADDHEQCNVCFEPYGGECYALPCGHVFHRQCIEGIIRAASGSTMTHEELNRGVVIKHVCPMDRKPFGGMGRSNGPMRLYLRFDKMSSGAGSAGGAPRIEGTDEGHNDRVLAQAQSRITQLTDDFNREEGRSRNLQAQLEQVVKDHKKAKTELEAKSSYLKQAMVSAELLQSQLLKSRQSLDRERSNSIAAQYLKSGQLEKMEMDLESAARASGRRRPQGTPEEEEVLAVAELRTMAAALQLRIMSLEKDVESLRESKEHKEARIHDLNAKIAKLQDAEKLAFALDNENRKIKAAQSTMREEQKLLRKQVATLQGQSVLTGTGRFTGGPSGVAASTAGGTSVVDKWQPIPRKKSQSASALVLQALFADGEEEGDDTGEVEKAYEIGDGGHTPQIQGGLTPTYLIGESGHEEGGRNVGACAVHSISSATPTLRSYTQHKHSGESNKAAVECDGEGNDDPDDEWSGAQAGDGGRMWDASDWLEAAAHAPSTSSTAPGGSALLKQAFDRSVNIRKQQDMSRGALASSWPVDGLGRVAPALAIIGYGTLGGSAAASSYVSSDAAGAGTKRKHEEDKAGREIGRKGPLTKRRVETDNGKENAGKGTGVKKAISSKTHGGIAAAFAKVGSVESGPAAHNQAHASTIGEVLEID